MVQKIRLFEFFQYYHQHAAPSVFCDASPKSMPSWRKQCSWGELTIFSSPSQHHPRSWSELAKVRDLTAIDGITGFIPKSQSNYVMNLKYHNISHIHVITQI